MNRCLNLGSRKFIYAIALSLMVGAASVRDACAFGFDFGSLGSATNAAVESIVKTIAMGADHHPYASAKPLGLLVGLDVGVDATAISLPKEFNDALSLMGSTGSVPPVIPIPRLNIRKGLPFGVDLGFSYIGYDKYKLIGFDAQWAVIRGMVLPNLAIRGSMNWSNLDVVHTKTYSVDAVLSKSLIFMDPYLGVGIQFAHGSLAVPVGALPITVTAEKDISAARIFFGLPIKMLFLHLTPEYNYSFSGFQTYGAKISIAI